MKMPWEDDKIYHNQVTSNKFGYSQELISTNIERNKQRMQVVINISKEKYDEINSLKFVQYGLQSEENKKLFYLLINAIQDGITLPKGHGRLIDADALQEDCLCWETDHEVSKAPTIIETDKENK